jgi:hypothetical protein
MRSRAVAVAVQTVAQAATSGQAGGLPPGLVADSGAAAIQTVPGAAPSAGFADVVAPASESGGPFEGLPFEALPALTPGSEGALVLSAALATLAGLALAARGSGPTLASLPGARFFLAGVPPVPVRCMVGATVNRHASALTAATAGLVGDGGVLGIRASGGKLAGAAGDKVATVRKEVRDGFVRGTDRGKGMFGDDDAGGTPLWMIAMMLGTVYFAFITACIWVARRPSGGIP